MAVRKKDFRENSAEKILKEQPGYVFFQPRDGATLPEPNYKAAVNRRTNRLVIITGRVQIRSRTAESLEAVATEFQLEPAQVFPHLNLGFYLTTGKSVEGLSSLLQTLLKDKRVLQAELEIIDEQKLPQ